MSWWTYIVSHVHLTIVLQNYNTAAKPFGSPAPRPDVDAVTQQTSQLSFAP